MSQLSFTGPGKLSGIYTPPGDKSISHRALLFGALAEGESAYENFLESEDCLHTLEALRRMGISIRHEKGTRKIAISGKGVHGLTSPGGELYLGNSGTSMRLLLGILAGQKFETVLTGDPSLSGRPMRRVTDPLKQMGAQIKGKENGNFAPLIIRGGKLRGISFDNKLSSAQVKSALLFAGMYAEGKTVIHEGVPSRDHTERFLEASGASFRREGKDLVIERTEKLRPFQARIAGDISSAAFFIAGAAMIPGSEVTVRDVGLNPTRTGLLEVLKRMGAKIRTEVTQTVPEPMGNIYVQGARLHGTGITHAEIPSLIDELPVLMVAMALSEGESLISGAAELRVKETDRIRSMVGNLKAIGASVEELPDGSLIRGVEGFHGASVESFGDHRTAMSMAVASLVTKGAITVKDTECIATSYPAFEEHFNALLNR
ncbi:MAG TPA: 3-phosphoshikimate 1-carboxyvinyltransferase [Candidatus Omnitrophota bacterium]|nr:3-phosphoshikimate 1-carboxyvinyltransferase [Candidatus Omnitrophota bacterium]HPS37340.1 3-phosphoshikimate 1-carboxyvinyltransferase [Candidatus Omnitrophota bacterium]